MFVHLVGPEIKFWVEWPEHLLALTDMHNRIRNVTNKTAKTCFFVFIIK